MERYQYCDVLGEGAYGEVWKCRERETGRLVAIKRFKDAHTDPEVMKLALREVRLLKASRHRNIVRLLEAFRTTSGRVYVVLEYVERTITKDLKAYPRGLPPAPVKLLTWQLVQAVAALHRSQILHRDIKPANILVSDEGVLKLCDFSFARKMAEKPIAQYSEYVVTRWYRPPEVIVNDLYGPAVDVWAIGCVFAELASGRALFPGKTNADQLHLILQCFGSALPLKHLQLAGTDARLRDIQMPQQNRLVPLEVRFPKFAPDMMQLMRACLHPDPQLRLSAEQLLKLPYFKDIPDLIRGTILDDSISYNQPTPRASPQTPQDLGGPPTPAGRANPATEQHTAGSAAAHHPSTAGMSASSSTAAAAGLAAGMADTTTSKAAAAQRGTLDGCAGQPSSATAAAAAVAAAMADRASNSTLQASGTPPPHPPPAVTATSQLSSYHHVGHGGCSSSAAINSCSSDTGASTFSGSSIANALRAGSGGGPAPVVTPAGVSGAMSASSAGLYAPAPPQLAQPTGKDPRSSRVSDGDVTASSFRDLNAAAGAAHAPGFTASSAHSAYDRASRAAAAAAMAAAAPIQSAVGISQDGSGAFNGASASHQVQASTASAAASAASKHMPAKAASTSGAPGCLTIGTTCMASRKSGGSSHTGSSSVSQQHQALTASGHTTHQQQQQRAGGGVSASGALPQATRRGASASGSSGLALGPTLRNSVALAAVNPGSSNSGSVRQQSMLPIHSPRSNIGTMTADSSANALPSMTRSSLGAAANSSGLPNLNVNSTSSLSAHGGPTRPPRHSSSALMPPPSASSQSSAQIKWGGSGNGSGQPAILQPSTFHRPSSSSALSSHAGLEDASGQSFIASTGDSYSRCSLVSEEPVSNGGHAAAYVTSSQSGNNVQVQSLSMHKLQGAVSAWQLQQDRDHTAAMAAARGAQSARGAYASTAHLAGSKGSASERFTNGPLSAVSINSASSAGQHPDLGGGRGVSGSAHRDGGGGGRRTTDSPTADVMRKALRGFTGMFERMFSASGRTGGVSGGAAGAAGGVSMPPVSRHSAAEPPME